MEMPNRRPDGVEQQRRQRSRATALDALYHAELQRARWTEERERWQPDPVPLPRKSWEECLIQGYPEGDVRQDWMRRQLARWRGEG